MFNKSTSLNQNTFDRVQFFLHFLPSFADVTKECIRKKDPPKRNYYHLSCFYLSVRFKIWMLWNDRKEYKVYNGWIDSECLDKRIISKIMFFLRFFPIYRIYHIYLKWLFFKLDVVVKPTPQKRYILPKDILRSTACSSQNAVTYDGK